METIFKIDRVCFGLMGSFVEKCKKAINLYFISYRVSWRVTVYNIKREGNGSNEKAM